MKKGRRKYRGPPHDITPTAAEIDALLSDLNEMKRLIHELAQPVPDGFTECRAENFYFRWSPRAN
jgi:hypothetical protein